jgi:1-acyl-sn-glycerol-3-phosphate acyltransferase
MATGSYSYHAFSKSTRLRALRSLLFFGIYGLYVVCVMAPIQWLIITPLLALLPSRRSAVMRAWLRLQAATVLSMARLLADLKVTWQGSVVEPNGCIVVMNHQSLLDIPLGVRLVTGPYPLIPTRSRYAHGIPGISRLIRLARYPFVSQGRTATREELASLLAAADEVARGDQSFLIYPEGHRTTNGQVGPFMPAGLGLVLSRARQRPVYMAVVDGLWHLRSFTDTALRIAGTRVRVTIRGPYTIPSDRAEIDKFIQELRETMVETLNSGRSAPTPTPALAPAPHPAG